MVLLLDGLKRQVYAQARQLPAILEDVEVLITPTRPRGRVGITMPHDIAHKFFLPVLKPFQAAYPEIQLDMILDDARLNLIEGQIDLAIRVGIPKEESFIARVMHEEAVQIFASPEYIQTIGPLETLQDLEKCHWILLSQMSQTQILHLRQGETTIEIKPEKFYRCDSPLMVQQMIRQGLGIGCILPNIIKKEIQTGQFVRVMPSLTSEAIIFALIYPSRRQLPLRTRTVISYLLATKMFG